MPHICGGKHQRSVDAAKVLNIGGDSSQWIEPAKKRRLSAWIQPEIIKFAGPVAHVCGCVSQITEAKTCAKVPSVRRTGYQGWDQAAKPSCSGHICPKII
jgi:hypothetical protein